MAPNNWMGLFFICLGCLCTKIYIWVRLIPDFSWRLTGWHYCKQGSCPKASRVWMVSPMLSVMAWRRSRQKGYPIIWVLLVVLWWPCTWAGMTKGRRMRSPLPSVQCLDSNSRLALRYRFGLRNKDTMSLGCVALVHSTLLTFIKYYSNTYMDIQVPHTGYTHGWCLTSGGSS